MAEDFDLTTCQEMLVDHGFTVPMALFWKNNTYGNVKTIPVCINTVQLPFPSPGRCFKLGQAIGRAGAGRIRKISGWSYSERAGCRTSWMASGPGSLIRSSI